MSNKFTIPKLSKGGIVVNNNISSIGEQKHSFDEILKTFENEGIKINYDFINKVETSTEKLLKGVNKDDIKINVGD